VCSTLFDVQYVAHARYFNDTLVENSLPLFRYLVEEMKYRILKCDVVFTKDNIPVLMHTTIYLSKKE
jgi:glycerophosphoryl diester phosphodiesterase